jgi:hypothetical protein
MLQLGLSLSLFGERIVQKAKASFGAVKKRGIPFDDPGIDLRRISAFPPYRRPIIICPTVL